MKARISQVLQLLVALVAWLAFAAMWWWAFASRGPIEDQLRDLAAIAVFSLLVVVVTSLWVRYNVRLYHRKGPRMRIPDGGHDYSRDTLGRTVIADFDTLAYERFVIVRVLEGPNGPIKSYEPGTHLPATTDEMEPSCTTSCSA